MEFIKKVLEVNLYLFILSYGMLIRELVISSKNYI